MSQNPPKILEKCAKNHPKSRFRGVRGALGRGLGSMVVPRDAQEPKNIQKPRSRSPWDPPVGVHFRHFLRFVGVFLCTFFQTFLLWIFLSISDLPGPQKQWFCASRTSTYNIQIDHIHAVVLRSMPYAERCILSGENLISRHIISL